MLSCGPLLKVILQYKYWRTQSSWLEEWVGVAQRVLGLCHVKSKGVIISATYYA